MQFLWRYIDDLIGKGLEFKIIAELLLYTCASLVPMALPLAILMSSLMTFGNMGEFYELTAIKSSGISLQRIMMPLIILVFFISIGAFFFANEVLPYTNLKMRSLLYDVRNQRPEIQIIPGSFYNGIDGYSVRVDRKNPYTNMMYDVKIYDHTQNRGNVSVTIADSGRMIVTEDERNLIFTLYHGYSYNELEDEKSYRRRKTYPHRFDRFDEEQIIIELVGFALTRTDENLFRNHYSMLDLKQLGVMKDSINKDIAEKENIMHQNLVENNYFRRRTPYYLRHEIPRVKPDSLVPNPYKVRSLQTMKHRLDTVIPSVTREINEIRPNQKVQSKKSNTDPKLYRNLFDKLTLREKDDILESALSYARSARTYIISAANSIDAKTRNLRKFEIEWQRKFTIAFACFVFLFIGAPLGAIIRKGGLGLPLVISTLFFIFYYIISLMGEKVVRESIMKDYQGMWIASMIFFITGIFLTYKATTDAAILNFETYSNFIQKYLGVKRINVLEAIHKENRTHQERKIKYDKLIASLDSFRDKIAEAIDDIVPRLRFSGFLVSIAGFRESSNILLLERLYKNIIYSIIDSDLAEDRSIRNKLAEFPNFVYRNYLDLKWRLYLRLIFLFIPPFTIIILVRHYIQLLTLKSRLRNIALLVDDLILLLRKNEAMIS
jgi:lipopolysaccharide export system permease protein